jgi:hypothetical protein
MSDLQEPVVVYKARDLIEAQAVHDALEAAGIGARVEGESLTGVWGETQIGEGSLPRVTVQKEDESAAIALLVRLGHILEHDKAPVPDQTCLACGAPMGTSKTCPKCGWTYDVPGVEIT